jgi:hypothetical protein
VVYYRYEADHGTQRNATQRNATQRNATQRNATQRKYYTLNRPFPSSPNFHSFKKYSFLFAFITIFGLDIQPGVAGLPNTGKTLLATKM